MAALWFSAQSSTAFLVIFLLLPPPQLLYPRWQLAHSSLRDCSVITTILASFWTAFSGANSVGVNICFWKIFCCAYLQSKSLLAPHLAWTFFPWAEPTAILQIFSYRRNQICRDLNA